MNTITFTREQGGIPASLPGQDHISGFIFGMTSVVYPTTTITEEFSASEPIHAISTIEAAEKMGITSDNSNYELKILHYHLSEIFRINPAISLFVGITDFSQIFDFVDEMQNYASGNIRQLAIYNLRFEQSNITSDIASLQGRANALRDAGTPLHILYSGNNIDLSTLPQLRASGQQDISFIIGNSGTGIAKKLFDEGISTSDIGTVLGLLSKAKVHESIGWVQKFNSGIALPGFIDGSLIRDVDRAIIEQLDADGYIFFVTYPGIGGSYVNDSHTLDVATSDYAHIERNRTMDKAERGIRTYLTPYIAAPLYVDAETGKLSIDTVKFLETLAGKQLEDMEAAGELSGYKVFVDPDQNVLANSTVEFVIKQVPVGVMRKINVKIGYTTSVS